MFGILLLGEAAAKRQTTVQDSVSTSVSAKSMLKQSTAMFVVTETGMSSQNMNLLHPNQVILVPKPNQTTSTTKGQNQTSTNLTASLTDTFIFTVDQMTLCRV